jgi:hypothetical protein
MIQRICDEGHGAFERWLYALCTVMEYKQQRQPHEDTELPNLSVALIIVQSSLLAGSSLLASCPRDARAHQDVEGIKKRRRPGLRK